MTHDPREALEPCPFCGTELDIDRNISDTGVYWVMCHQCYAEGPPVNPKAEAIKAWNTRALTASPGVVSVELLNIERATGDRLRSENDKLRAAIASPGEQKPFGWLGRDGKFSLPVEMTRERFLSHFHDNDPPVGTPVIPLYLSAPPAAGWDITDDMVERACKAYADATGYYVEFHRGLSSPSADGMRKGMRAALSALRREAPAPEGGFGKWAVCERCGGSCGCRVPAPSRPDAGGGVREELSAWSSLPRDIYVIGAQRVNAVGYDVQCCSVPMATVPEVRYVRADMIAAFSTPPAAAESNASVEARLREALAAVTTDLIRIADKDEDPLEWASVKQAYGVLGISAVGDEAKESEGGCICQDQHRRGYCTEPGCPYAIRPSDPTAERREIVVRALMEKWPGDYAWGDETREPNELAFETADAILAALDGGAGA